MAFSKTVNIFFGKKETYIYSILKDRISKIISSSVNNDASNNRNKKEKYFYRIQNWEIMSSNIKQ